MEVRLTLLTILVGKLFRLEYFDRMKKIMSLSKRQSTIYIYIYIYICESLLNALLTDLLYLACMAKISILKKKGPSKKFPMSVAPMSR